MIFKWTYDQWTSIPPEWRAAFVSWVKSVGLGLFTILGVMYGVASSQGKANDPITFLHWCDANWWGMVMGFIFSSGSATYRGAQAHNAIKTDTVIAP